MALVTAGTWNIDPSHSEIAFTVRHLMSKVRGRFNEFESQLVTTEDGVGSTLSATVKLASVNTGTAQRDEHLRSSDFFSVEKNPEMTFQSTSVKQHGENFIVAGDLTVNGISKPIELDAEFLGEGPGMMEGETRLGFEATGTVSRGDFGVDFNMPAGGDKMVIGDKVTVTITGEYSLA